MTPEILLGPPGTGKTTTNLNILEEELANGTKPERIGYVTFTRRGAEEAINRAGGKFQLSHEDLPYFRTLHSLCFRQLSLTRKDVLEGPRLKDFAKYAGIRITGNIAEDGTMTGYSEGDRVLHMINLARIMRVTTEELYNRDDDGLPWREVARVEKALTQYKLDNQLQDYTDMLENFLLSGIRLKLDVLVVDEAQDLSEAQWAVVWRLAESCRRVVIAGDDDQAIFRWAGAAVEHLIRLQGDVRVLEQSYRVPRAVQRIAGGIIGSVVNRREKEWSARDDEGSVSMANWFHDVSLDGEESVLVLARNTYLLDEWVVPVLRREGILFERNDRPSVGHTLLNAIVSWESLRRGEEVTIETARDIYQYMSTGTGVARGYKELRGFNDDEKVDAKWLTEKGGLRRTDVWYEALERIPRGQVQYIRHIRSRGEKLRERPRVRVSTIHASKGGEADHVVLLSDMAKRTYDEMERNVEDEARVWYVAVTRAKQRLTVVKPMTKQSAPWLRRI